MVCSSSWATRTSRVTVATRFRRKRDSKWCPPIPCCNKIPIAADEATIPLRTHSGFRQSEMQCMRRAFRERAIHRNQILNLTHLGRKNDPFVRPNQCHWLGQPTAKQIAPLLPALPPGAVRDEPRLLIFIHQLCQQCLIERAPIDPNANRFVVADRRFK